MSTCCRFAAFVVADADGLFDAADKDFAVADPAGPGSALDVLDRLLLQVLCDYQLNLDLGQEVDGIFTPAINLGMALLAAVAASLENGHAFDARFEEGILHSIQLGWLENGFNFEHMRNASSDRDRKRTRLNS